MSTQNAKTIAPNSTFSFAVSAQYREGVRIDKYISDQFPFYSRNYFQHLINEGLVGVNGQVASKQSLMVKEDDAIIITFPPERQIDEEAIYKAITQKQLDIEVVAEDEYFLIIYKPANLLVHPPYPRSNAITLVDWLVLQYKELAAIGPSDRPAIVHRLDKDTSGLLIIPRTPYAHKAFSYMFRNRTINKTYHAIVHGNPSPSGVIDFSIGRDPHNKKKMGAFITSNCSLQSGKGVYTSTIEEDSKLKENRIRSALTHYRVLEYYKNHALVEIKLITGRMHQIRVHFTAIGHPIVGDPIYGSKSKIIKRQALHASCISFKLGKKEYCFSKGAPDDFRQLLNYVKKTQ